MAKKNSRSGKRSGKSRHSKRSKGIGGQLEEVTEALSDGLRRVPTSAIYWGLGALALGAAAVGAYRYREEIMELYEDAVESFESDDTESDTELPRKEATGKEKSTSGAQPERH